MRKVIPYYIVVGFCFKKEQKNKQAVKQMALGSMAHFPYYLGIMDQQTMGSPQCPWFDSDEGPMLHVMPSLSLPLFPISLSRIKLEHWKYL